MGKKLYVGNLAYNTTQDQVEELFTQVGTVEQVIMIMDRETRQFRGFCYVTMATDNEAKEAIKRLEGYALDGRTLHVDEAHEREPRSNGNRGRL